MTFDQADSAKCLHRLVPAGGAARLSFLPGTGSIAGASMSCSATGTAVRMAVGYAIRDWTLPASCKVPNRVSLRLRRISSSRFRLACCPIPPETSSWPLLYICGTDPYQSRYLIDDGLTRAASQASISASWSRAWEDRPIAGTSWLAHHHRSSRGSSPSNASLRPCAGNGKPLASAPVDHVRQSLRS